MKGNRTYLRIVFFALFLGVFSRIFLLSFFPLNFDELIQYDILSLSKWKEVSLYLRHHERQLPLAYMLYYPIVKIFPHNLLVLRIPGILISLLSLFVFWKCSCLFFKKEKALFSTALFGIAFYPLNFTHTMRPYPLLILLTLSGLYFLTKILRAQFDLKNMGGLFLSVFLMMLTHPYGLLQAVSFLFVLAVVLFRRFKLFKVAPFLSFAFWGVTYLLFLILNVFFLKNSSFYHPNYIPPSILKILGAGVLTTSGHLNALIFLGLFLNYHIIKKRKFSVPEVNMGLFFLILPFIAGIFISWSYFPVFELRYLAHTSIFFSLLFTHYLYESCGEFFKTKRFLQSLSLLSIVFFLVFQKNFYSLSNKIDIPGMIKNHPELKTEVVLNCGNCPSFYFDADRIKCIRGWDFKIKPDKNLEKKEKAVLIFKQNINFCKDFIPKRWKEYSYDGVLLFLSP